LIDFLLYFWKKWIFGTTFPKGGFSSSTDNLGWQATAEL
jgi:hypothetical protein